MSMNIAAQSRNKSLRWIDLLAIIIPMIIYLVGASVASFRTSIQQGDNIQTMQVSIKETKDQIEKIQAKEDERYAKIISDLTEIKLLLKDKQDRK